jgi:UDP-N-acetylmuramate dehydrogenase
MMALPAGIERDVALRRFTTIGTGGPAAFLGEPANDQALVDMLRWAHDTEQLIAVIGLGSNLLPADTGFDGLVLRLDGELARIEVREGGAVLGGGASLAAAVRKVGDAGLAGFEFACAIPGTMGGAVRMNAGAYGREIVDVLVTATISSAAGTRTVSASALGLTYRNSNLAYGEIVTAAEIALTADDPALIKERVREFQGRRSAAQPRKARTFGSVFKNPEGDRTSGQLLEACGLKGYRVGGAQISEKHANFIENVDSATSADVVALMTEARRRAKEQFGVELHHEVQTLGDITIPPV